MLFFRAHLLFVSSLTPPPSFGPISSSAPPLSLFSALPFSHLLPLSQHLSPTSRYLLSLGALSFPASAPNTPLPSGTVRSNRTERRAFVQPSLAELRAMAEQRSFVRPYLAEQRPFVWSKRIEQMPSFGPIWSNDVGREGGAGG